MKTFTSLLCFILSILSASFSGAEEALRCGLEVTSEPAGATVWVNHANRGVTPLTLSDLSVGDHLVRITKQGYRDAFSTVSLQAGVLRQTSFSLRREEGLLLVVTDPPACEISEKGVSLGQSPLLLTSLPVGNHRLTISLPGYQTKEVDVALEGRTPARVEVGLLSDSGTLDVTSDPVGAEVFVNGISRGKTPCKVDRIPGGEATLEVKASGYQQHARTVSLVAGERQAVNIKLAPLPGTLRIVSLPPRARVYVENEFEGMTPCDLLKLKPGTYRVRVELAGHDPLARNIEVAKGASQTEEFRLSPNTGRIELMTSPAQVMVFLDGKRKGLTLSHKRDLAQVSDPLALEDIPEGEHEVRLVRKGFEPVIKKIQIERGKTLPIQAKLTRQFIPDYEVVTTRSRYKGVLEFKSDEGIRLEISPGISQTIPMKDVKKHGYLEMAE